MVQQQKVWTYSYNQIDTEQVNFKNQWSHCIRIVVHQVRSLVRTTTNIVLCCLQCEFFQDAAVSMACGSRQKRILSLSSVKSVLDVYPQLRCRSIYCILLSSKPPPTGTRNVTHITKVPLFSNLIFLIHRNAWDYDYYIIRSHVFI
jgi:hypothetical protein